LRHLSSSLTSDDDGDSEEEEELRIRVEEALRACNPATFHHDDVHDVKEEETKKKKDTWLILPRCISEVYTNI